MHIVTDPRIDRITLAKLRALGCEVDIVEAMSGAGWQSARLERLAQLMDRLPGAFCPRQYQNPDNPLAYRGLADELVADLPRIDVLVGSVGSGGSLCGTSRVLRETFPGLRVVGVDCVGSVLFDQPDRPRRLQSGLGNSLHPANLDRGVIDEVHWLNDHEAFAAARDLAGEQKIFAGNTSGSVYRVLSWLAGQASAGTTLVGIFPDRGDRYADTVYRDEHWTEHELAKAPRRSRPQRVSYGSEVHAWSCASPCRPADRRREIVFIESNTTGTGMLAIERARALGLNPVFVTGDPARYRDLPADEIRIIRCDTNSLVALRRMVRDHIRREDCAGITTTSDFYLSAVAELTDLLRLPGNHPRTVSACRDKAVLRSALTDAGLPQPRFATARRPDEVRAAVRSVGLPCVVKPVDDSGSRHVLRCTNEADALAAAALVFDDRVNVRGQAMQATVLVEQYLNGREFSVEMFGRADRTVCVGITETQLSPAPHCVETRHVFPAEVPAEVAAEIERTVRAALAVVGFRHGASHTEVRLAGGEVMVIEINGRLAGGMIPELVRLATGVDLVDQQIRAACGLATEPARQPTESAGIQFVIASDTGTLDRFEGAEEAGRLAGVETVALTAGAGTLIRPAQDAYDRLGYVIARGARPADVAETLNKARELIQAVVTRKPVGADPTEEGDRACEI